MCYPRNKTLPPPPPSPPVTLDVPSFAITPRAFRAFQTPGSPEGLIQTSAQRVSINAEDEKASIPGNSVRFYRNILKTSAVDRPGSTWQARPILTLELGLNRVPTSTCSFVP